MRELLWRLVAWIVTTPAISNRLIARALRTPYTDIEVDGDVYMRRWWLFNPYPSSDEGRLQRHLWLPLSVRVHHILRPDSDRSLHDHPWDARTIILGGWYVEVREDGNYSVRLRGDTAALRYGEYHRITRVSGHQGAYTLFITFKYRGTWGFLVNDRKVPWREHLGLGPK